MFHCRTLSARCSWSTNVKSHLPAHQSIYQSLSLSVLPSKSRSFSIKPSAQRCSFTYSNRIIGQSENQSANPRTIQLAHHSLASGLCRGLHLHSQSTRETGNQLIGDTEHIPVQITSQSIEQSASTHQSIIQAPHSSLIFRALPSSTHPYLELARLDKPIGTWLLLFPCWWSVALAAQPNPALMGLCLPDSHLMGLFAVGALLMRGAGCTINDMWDRGFDRRVERTLKRPLASGAVNYTQAFAFLTLQLAGGLALVLNFNMWTIAVAFGSIPIVIAYPLMKRITNWPQFVLGLCFNWGAIVGYSAVVGTIEPAIVLPLYAAGVAWTLVYDTIYAHQDVKDDTAIGLKSTAIFFNDKTHIILSCFAVGFVSLLALSGYYANVSMPFYLISVGGSAMHLLYQLKTLNIHDRALCMRLFVSNQAIGWIVLVGIIVAKIYQSVNQPESINQSVIEEKAVKSVKPNDDIWHKTGWQLIKEEYTKHGNTKQ